MENMHTDVAVKRDKGLPNCKKYSDKEMNFFSPIYTILFGFSGL